MSPDFIAWGVAICAVVVVGTFVGWLVLNSLNKSRGDGT